MTPEQETWDYESAKAGWMINGARVVAYMNRMWEAERLLAERKEEKA